MPSNRTPLYIIGSIIVVAIAAIVVYAMSQNSVAPAVNTQDTSETDQVIIEGFSYSPATITVKVGTKVTWTNQDSVVHTAVTTENGAPVDINSGRFDEGESFSFTFDKAGTYPYYCELHPQMKGTVLVTE